MTANHEGNNSILISPTAKEMLSTLGHYQEIALNMQCLNNYYVNTKAILSGYLRSPGSYSGGDACVYVTQKTHQLNSE